MIFLRTLAVSFFLAAFTSVVSISLQAVTAEKTNGIQVFKTIHGELIVDDPLAIELINSPMMQRLKSIRMYGVNAFVVKKRYYYNRFEHCLSVYQILKKHGASRVEQIAGLLHDASHTVFSHTTDFLFMGGMNKGAYQDQNHAAFLSKYGAETILKKHGLTIAQIMPDQHHFRRLEQEAPALCADRMEYNIHAGDLENILTPTDIKSIHDSLHFDGKNWYFDDAKHAEKLARISLVQTVKTWGDPGSILLAKWTSKAIKILWDKKDLSYDDVHFNLSDEDLWKKLSTAKDATVRDLMVKINNVEKYYVHNDKDYDDVLKAKFRGIDPYVMVNGKLVLLTDISASYKADFEKTKKIMADGWKVKYSVTES